MLRLTTLFASWEALKCHSKQVRNLRTIRYFCVGFIQSKIFKRAKNGKTVFIIAVKFLRFNLIPWLKNGYLARIVGHACHTVHLDKEFRFDPAGSLMLRLGTSARAKRVNLVNEDGTRGVEPSLQFSGIKKKHLKRTISMFWSTGDVL